MSDSIYVGNLKESPELLAWETEHNRLEKELEEKAEFLKKQADEMNKKWTANWRELFDMMKDRGGIEKNCRYEDYKIAFNDSTKQVFIKEKNSGLPDFIKKLLE